MTIYYEVADQELVGIYYLYNIETRLFCGKKEEKKDVPKGNVRRV